MYSCCVNIALVVWMQTFQLPCRRKDNHGRLASHVEVGEKSRGVFITYSNQILGQAKLRYYATKLPTDMNLIFYS